MVCSSSTKKTKCDMMEGKLRLLSYNSTGLGGNKTEYIGKLIEDLNIDILLIQETWLIRGNLLKLNGIHQDYLAYGVSGIDESKVLLGRPYGGLAVLWHKSVAQYVKRVDSGCERLCCISLQCENKTLLIVNAYMPVDNMSKTHVGNDFLQVCDAIETLFNRFPEAHYVVAGDMNIDFHRKNANDIYFKNMLERHDCKICWDLNVSESDYTYSNVCSGSFSQIDHFCFQHSLVPLIDNVSVYDCPLNPSGHRPVLATVKVSCGRAKEPRTDTNKHINIVWHKVSNSHITEYKATLDCLIRGLPNYHVYTCENLQCNNKDHLLEINSWCSSLVECCLQADNVFPRHTRAASKCIAGWNENVKPYKSDCIWWYNLWKQGGKQRHGLVFENMKTSRKLYMYAIRRCKRNEKQIRYQKMAESIKDNKTRDFFKEIKRMNSVKQVKAEMINKETDPKRIAEIFANKYVNLFSSVPFDEQIMNGCKEDINHAIHNLDYTHSSVSIDDVKEAVGRLKSDKRDGDAGLMSNHLIYASECFYHSLARLMTTILSHGYQPETILKATLCSIPKDKKGDMCTDNNYRGIVLTSAIGKVFDILLLNRNSEKLITSDLQFAFKKKLGTAMCTLVIKEVVSYYLRSGSYVAACFLDVSKAFDRVRFDRLFQLLIKRGVNALDLRALMDLYLRQRTRTEWHGYLSQEFGSINGIRQGSVISPLLYCVYVDELLERLCRDGCGCWIGNNFVGSVCYADDLTLMCPSIKGLQQMIKTCETFAEEYGMMYNSSKSVCMLFNKKCDPSNMSKVTLEGNALEWVTVVKHLGNYLKHNLSEDKEIQIKRGDLVGRVNVILSNLQGAPDEVISSIFASQCHLYGCQTWRFRDSSVNDIHTMWNRSVRRLLNLPQQTHTRYLPHLLGVPHSKVQVFRMFAKMMKTMLNSDNRIVCYVARAGVQNANTIIGDNIKFIQRASGISDIMEESIPRDIHPCCGDEMILIETIKELRVKVVPFLQRDEQYQLICFLCTN